MEHRREFTEMVEDEPDEVHALSDPTPRTRDDSIQGRGRGNEAPSRETWLVISSSLGAMRPLVAKLDKLLLAHPNDGMGLLSNNVAKISSYVDGLSEVENPPPTAKCWMNEARGLSYDMEDYIDSLIFVQPAGASLVDKDMEVDKLIEAMVSEFSKHVQEAIERYKAYVPPDSGPSSSLRRRFVSHGPMLPTSYEDIVIDGRMDEFINSFAEDGDKQLKVVWILGSACLGKTTLARVLYTKFGMHYECRAFVRVSRKPDMKRIFCDMLWQLQWQEPPEYRNEPDLVDNIKKYLRNKRYLIIVDDVWAASVWDTINDALPKGSHGSRIVPTTQIEDVALTCCYHESELVFEMKPLDDDHSRELFFNRIFGSESNCPEIFQEASNGIVELCDGLPFATISIASLLASQPVITEDLLEHIHESLSSCFSASSTSERTRQALNLSFNNLPLYLKTCLLYLGMYPEGYTFCSNDLVRQWIAEGFIHIAEGQDAEKVAESYLHQLIVRRFIQPIRINYNNEVLSCTVHDTMHDLIAHKSAEENFIVAIVHSQKNVALSYKARRLSLLFGDARYAKTSEKITKSQVRSLTYFGLLECMPRIKEFKLLRVLVLQISGHGGEDNPVDLSEISKLMQLRYLKIGCGVCIIVPTNGLKCLETLDIADAIVLGSSQELILPRLLHLSLPFEGIQMYCRLNPLDSEEGLDTDGLSSLIKGHGNLRTVVFSHGSTVKNTLVHGAIKVITPKPSKEAITSGSPLLQEFKCSPASGTIFFVIPKWFKDLQNLCILKIAVRILKMDCVGILRGLRALTALSLHVGRETNDLIIFDQAGFSALKYFNLRFATGIPWLIFEKDTMPNLWKLKLVFNAIPKMDKRHYFFSSHPGRPTQYKTGDPLIIIEHMPSLREIDAKFEGPAADLERIKGIGISIDQGINPAIVNMQLVDSGSYGDHTKQEQEEETLEKDSADKRSPESLHVFTLDELMSATSNFSEENFKGENYRKRNLHRTFCFPGVYTGSFDGKLRPGLEPQQVMVKCVNKFTDHHEWMMVDQMDLEYLGALSCHPHLVKLLGFCDYYEHRMLVYEYTPSTTLKKYLSDGVRNSSWLTRLKIAVGTAKGLAFLHEADKTMADFETSNVLLDLNDRAKVFGYHLANENSPQETPHSLMAERDVYRFGEVLLKLLASPEADRVRVERPTMECRAEWWRRYLCREDKLHHIMDPRLKGRYSGHAAWGTATIVRRCLHSVPEKRPSMRYVVEALEPLLLLVDDDKPSSQTMNAYNDGAAAGYDDKAGGWNGSKCIQLDVNWKDSYPPEWRGQHEFTLDELMSATSNFSEKNLLGEVDFGHIYGGAIDGMLAVAVMKPRPDCEDWLVPRAWLPELQHLESMSEPHLVRLLGYCHQDEQCVLLVYEYMPRGSLSDNNLLASIPWLTRLEIAVGAAKGLSLLHESGKQMIYHTGFTASNILLASDYTAKLWGFGLAKQSDVTTWIRMRADVYNFGVVLLELLAGRLAVEEIRLDPTTNLRKWIVDQLLGLRSFFPLRKKERFESLANDLRNILDLKETHGAFRDYIMDPSLQGKYSERAALTTVIIAWHCVQKRPDHRPSMQDVVKALETARDN